MAYDWMRICIDRTGVATCRAFPLENMHLFLMCIFCRYMDLKSTDLSCIYTTLLLVQDQAKKLNTVPTVTFDQPLYIKAKDISSAANLDFVCRLGGFHKPMNFLGAIGNLMKGSGLQEMLGLLYGPNTLEHIMSGKAYARSIRGHFIIHDALVQMLLLTVMDEGFKEQKCESEDPTSGLCADDVYGVVNQLYRQCWNDRILVEDCSNIKSQHLSNTACKLQAGLGFCRQKPVSATHEV